VSPTTKAHSLTPWIMSESQRSIDLVISREFITIKEWDVLSYRHKPNSKYELE
jgi:hypothetical protein